MWYRCVVQWSIKLKLKIVSNKLSSTSKAGLAHPLIYPSNIRKKKHWTDISIIWTSRLNHEWFIYWWLDKMVKWKIILSMLKSNGNLLLCKISKLVIFDLQYHFWPKHNCYSHYIQGENPSTLHVPTQQLSHLSPPPWPWISSLPQLGLRPCFSFTFSPSPTTSRQIIWLSLKA